MKCEVHGAHEVLTDLSPRKYACGCAVPEDREYRAWLEKSSAMLYATEFKEDHLLMAWRRARVGWEEQPELSLKAYERACIMRAMRQCDGSAVKAAKVLDISRTTMYRKLSEHGCV